MKTETLCFKIEGEFLTNLSRTLFVEGTPKKAVNLLTEGISNFPESFAIEVILGKKKLVGINNLEIKDDNVKEKHGIALSFEDSWNYIVTKFLEKLSSQLMYRARIQDFGTKATATGGYYRKPVACYGTGSPFENDKKSFLKVTKELKEVQDELEFIGKIINKGINDIPLHTLDVYPYEEEDYGFPRNSFSFEELINGKLDMSKHGKREDEKKIINRTEKKDKKNRKEKDKKIVSIIDSIKKEKESFNQVVGTYMIGKTEIYEDNNWDLNENLSGTDYEFYEYKNQKGIRPNRDSKGKIPVDIGCGIKACRNDEMFFTDLKHKDKIVTLEISTFIGSSFNAIHYYGCLIFHLPWLHYKKEPNTATSNFDLKLLSYGKIELTHKLEAWELKKYSKRYDTYKVGDSYRGFYTQDKVIKRGKEVFKDLFGKGWKLKIEKY